MQPFPFTGEGRDQVFEEGNLQWPSVHSLEGLEVGKEGKVSIETRVG